MWCGVVWCGVVVVVVVCVRAHARAMVWVSAAQKYLRLLPPLRVWCLAQKVVTGLLTLLS